MKTKDVEEVKAESITKLNRWRSDGGFLVDDGIDFTLMCDWLLATLTSRDTYWKEQMEGMADRLERQISLGADPHIAIQLERAALTDITKEG